MKIAIIGASGFIGRHLTDTLLRQTDYELVLFSHHAETLKFTRRNQRRITEINGDVLRLADIEPALQDCQMAIYLVHLMGNETIGKNLINAEIVAARNFVAATKKNGVRRVIYIGGMADEASRKLTRHLRSRQQTGDIIRGSVRQLIEFRTPMVVGDGGAGFDVLRQLVDRLPVLPVPRWARAVTQPITVHDVVRYILAAIDMAGSKHITVDIGGPDRISYVQLARRYAAHKNKPLYVITIPFVSRRLAAKVLKSRRRSPSARTVADMIESAGYSTKAIGQEARQLFPQIDPETVEQAF